MAGKGSCTLNTTLDSIPADCSSWEKREELSVHDVEDKEGSLQVRTKVDCGYSQGYKKRSEERDTNYFYV